jgi:hypothetical protein
MIEQAKDTVVEAVMSERRYKTGKKLHLNLLNSGEIPEDLAFVASMTSK